MRTPLLVAALVATASAAAAQLPSHTVIEIRPVVGAYIPTGEQRDVFKSAATYGIQAAYEHVPTFHWVGSFTWSPGHDKFTAVREDGVNIYQYDVGVERDWIRPLGMGWELKPFLGLGIGGRTYEYAADQLATKSCLAGYGAVGTEFQVGVTALRLEARDYVSCYKSPVVDESETRNDVGLSLGLAYHFGRRMR